MKITHIIFSLQVGGAESMLIDIMEEQANLGHDVHLIIINDEVNEILENSISEKVKIYKLRRKESSRNLLFVIKLYAILFRSNSDIVHCHNVAMGRLLQFYKGKKVITIHTTGSYLPELKNFDKVVAISKAVQDDLMKIGKCKSIIIHNGINVNNILTKENNFINNDLKIIQVGRLEHKIKGQDLLIKALHELKKLNLDINVSITFIGTGSSKKYLKNLVSDLELEESVEFLGLQDKNYIYEHLKDYDLLIQPSRYEGFGLTIIEGMAAKLPVIVSAIEGPMEVIVNGKLGLFFEHENSEMLARSIEKIIQDIDLNMVEKAYDYTLSNYTIENTTQKYIEVYIQLLGEKS